MPPSLPPPPPSPLPPPPPTLASASWIAPWSSGQLAQALVVLGSQVGVGDDPCAGLQAGRARVQDDRADRDARVERARQKARRAPRRRTARGGSPRARRSAASPAPSARPRPCRPGSTRRKGRSGEMSGSELADDLGDEVRDMREAFRLEEAHHAHRSRAARRARGVWPRSTSITCSARSFSEESSRSAWPSPGRVVRIGFSEGVAALGLDEGLGRGADEREAVKLEQNGYGEG